VTTITKPFVVLTMGEAADYWSASEFDTEDLAQKYIDNSLMSIPELTLYLLRVEGAFKTEVTIKRINVRENGEHG